MLTVSKVYQPQTENLAGATFPPQFSPSLSLSLSTSICRFLSPHSKLFTSFFLSTLITQSQSFSVSCPFLWYAWLCLVGPFFTFYLLIKHCFQLVPKLTTVSQLQNSHFDYLLYFWYYKINRICSLSYSSSLLMKGERHCGESMTFFKLRSKGYHIH